MNRRVVSVDPGTEKCGVARVVTEDGNVQVECREVVQTELICTAVARLLDSATDALVVGNGTGSKPVVKALEAAFPQTAILVVNERGTSERARERYWVENPPRGWRRLVPRGLLSPPEPYDDLAAVLLAEHVLAEMGH